MFLSFTDSTAVKSSLNKEKFLFTKLNPSRDAVRQDIININKIIDTFNIDFFYLIQ